MPNSNALFCHTTWMMDDVGLRRGTTKIGFLESYPLGWRCGRTLAVGAYPRCLTVPDLMAVDQTMLVSSKKLGRLGPYP